MRKLNIWAAVLAACLLGIGLPAYALAEDGPMAAVGVDFEPGAAIHVCWRMAEPGNPFAAKGPFNCETTIKAVDAPFSGGGVTGEQLMTVVEKVVEPGKIKEVRVRSLEVGKDAGNPSAGMITVDKDASEFYNNYVGRDKSGRLSIFLDVEAKVD